MARSSALAPRFDWTITIVRSLISRLFALHVLPKVKGGHFKGAPDVAIELVSLDSGERDYVVKREKYRQAGVSEYWIVDEIVQRVTMLRLDSRGRYREIKPHNGVYFSEVLTGFWFRPEWLWRSPLPKKLAILNEILAGPPNDPNHAA